MSMENFLLLMVAVIVLIPVLWGYHRGFLRTVASLASIVLAMFLVTYLQPYVMEGLHRYTPLEEKVDTAVRSVVKDKVRDGLLSQMQDAGYALTQDSPDTVLSEQDLSALDSWKLSRSMQNHLLDSLGLPKILQGQIQTSVEASADSFLENVCGFLTKTIMNTAGYLLTFLVVFLLIRILYLVTGLISYIPILHGINKVLGGVFGLAEAGVILWVLCQAVTVALPSDTGREVMQAIARNPILSYIYNTLFAIGSIL